MALNAQEKKKIVKKNHENAKLALSIITANTTGIKVNEINYLRKKARSSGIKMSIVRNTLLKKSILNTSFSLLKDTLKGPTLVAFSMEHPGSASRLFTEYSKKNKKFKIITAIFKKNILSIEEIKKLAEMPTYEEAIQKILYILQESSVKKFLRLLYQITQK